MTNVTEVTNVTKVTNVKKVTNMTEVTSVTSVTKVTNVTVVTSVTKWPMWLVAYMTKTMKKSNVTQWQKVTYDPKTYLFVTNHLCDQMGICDFCDLRITDQ